MALPSGKAERSSKQLKNTQIGFPVRAELPIITATLKSARADDLQVAALVSS